MPILSRTVLCGAIVACLSSAAMAEAVVQLPKRGIEAYDGYRHRQSSLVMIAVLLVLVIFTVVFILLWYRSQKADDSEPSHAWQDLEKQKAIHEEVFQKVDLSEPAPVVQHSTKKNRSTDTWDKYLSMIKSPSRLNSIVGKTATMNKNT